MAVSITVSPTIINETQTDTQVTTSVTASPVSITAVTSGGGGGTGDALTTNPLSQFAATTSAQLAGVITDETGTGALVFATSPALVTPALGTPASGVMTNVTGVPISTGISGLATGVAAFLATPTSANLAAAMTDETGSGLLAFGGGAGNALTANPLSQFAATTSAQLAGVLSDETGTGLVVFNTSPTLVTPVLGTPASGTLTNATGLPISTGVSGLAAGVATFLATPSSANFAAVMTDETGTGANVFATSPTLVTPILGTPTSGTLTNATGLPISTGVSGLGTGVATFLGTPTSANLAAALTDETGSGAAVFATSPTLVTPVLGTPTSVTLTNATGLPISTGVSGLAAGVAAFLATPSSANFATVMTDETGTGANVFATSPTLVTPILGTPTSATLTNATGLPISTGVSGLAAGVATFLATPNSANLAAAMTDETGTGANVFANTPTLVTPALGAATATSIAASGTVTGSNLSGTNTGDQTITLTGDVTGSGTGSFAATIAANAVTNAKAAQMVARTFKGNIGPGTANAADMVAADAMAALVYKTSSTASATNLAINGISNVAIEISGTTTIAGFGGAGTYGQTGTLKLLYFQGALTITNGANMVLPGNTDLVTAAGDYGVFEWVVASQWRCVLFQRYLAAPIVQRASGIDAFLGTPSSANLAAAMTDETGTGANVFATSPTLVTPILGTPTSATLTNATGLPISTGVSGLAAGVATFLATPSSANLAAVMTDETGTGAAVFATSPTLVTPILGTPTSGTLTNATGLPISTGVSGLAAGVATFLATPSSANFAAVMTDETGTGANVFATSPTLVTPALGTPSALVLTNATGLPVAGGGTGLTTLPGINNFRLSLTTGNPLPTADVTGATTIYLTPHNGSLMSMYDGTRWKLYQFTEKSIALGTLVNAQAYDVFCYDNSGTPTLEILEWANATVTMTLATPCVVTWTSHGMSTGYTFVLTTSSALYTGLTANTQYWVTVIDANTFKLSTTILTMQAGTFIATSGSQSGTQTGHQPQARATAIVQQDGVWCKTGALTRLLVGTFFTTATTTTEDSVTKRYVSNAFNAVNSTTQLVPTNDISTTSDTMGTTGDVLFLVLSRPTTVLGSIIFCQTSTGNNDSEYRLNIAATTSHTTRTTNVDYMSSMTWPKTIGGGVWPVTMEWHRRTATGTSQSVLSGDSGAVRTMAITNLSR